MGGQQKIDNIAGAKNLLENCAGCKAGQSLLIVHEAKNFDYYSDDLKDHVSGVAKDLGLLVLEYEVIFDANVDQLEDELEAVVSKADHVLFLARVGDQIRFKETEHADKMIVCYALDMDMMESRFGASNYHGFQKLKGLVDTYLNYADDIRVTCAAGTNISNDGAKWRKASSDTTIKRFPLSVFSPVPGRAFSGRIAQVGFLVGTGSTYYTPYSCEISDVLYVDLKKGRIVGFEGTPKDVATAKAHYRYVSETLGIDQNFVHSWHAGIHPGCSYPYHAGQNFERWSGGAFGNPRLLHFHTCGAYAPGEISLNVLDPTITANGIAIWEDGCFHPKRIPGGAEILADYPCIQDAFANPVLNIGQGKEGKLTFQDR